MTDKFIEWMEEDIKGTEHPGTRTALRLALAKYKELNGWVKVTPDEPLYTAINPGLSHFLVPVHDARVNLTNWEIITGYIDEQGDLVNQHDGSDAGWSYGDVLYYKPVGDLPPLPSPEKQQQ